MDRGVNTHRGLVWIVARDAFVHIEEVAVLGGYCLGSVAFDNPTEVEEDAALDGADALALIDNRLGVATGDVARNQVAERRVLAFEEVVAFVLGTQIRPSFRSDSDISVSFDWNSSLTGMQVGWIWV